MRKLYTAEASVRVYFWADDEDELELQYDAVKHLRSELGNEVTEPQVSEAKKPYWAEWRGSIPWGKAPEGQAGKTIGELFAEDPE